MSGAAAHPLLRIILLALVFAASSPAFAGAEGATVREYRKVFRTCPFSDPDPIPNAGRIYPYFRCDGFAEPAEDRERTVVELDNPWLRVLVLPEIGGKIWSTVEKSTGKEFLYGKHVVKFRDVAMRGTWTSGGIEANYGIFGDTPNCATPVDYLTRQNPDGTASDDASVHWRQQFISTFLTRDIPQLGITIPAEQLPRFWLMIAHYHARTWNASEIAGSRGINYKTAQHYLDILTGAFMIRSLPPWTSVRADSLQKRPPQVQARTAAA